MQRCATPGSASRPSCATDLQPFRSPHTGGESGAILCAMPLRCRSAFVIRWHDPATEANGSIPLTDDGEIAVITIAEER